MQYFDKDRYPDDWYLDCNQVEPQLWNLFQNQEGAKCNDKCPYRLPGRFSKRNFVNALICYRNNDSENRAWQKIIKSLEKLDYWIDKRNQIVHSAKGVSQGSMQILLQSEKSKQVKYSMDACLPEDILKEITNISKETSKIIKKPLSYIGIINTPYYIYSDIRDWVIGNLR